MQLERHPSDVGCGGLDARYHTSIAHCFFIHRDPWGDCPIPSGNPPIHRHKLGPSTGPILLTIPSHLPKGEGISTSSPGAAPTEARHPHQHRSAELQHAFGIGRGLKVGRSELRMG